jgi:hypothetical protein
MRPPGPACSRRFTVSPSLTQSAQSVRQVLTGNSVRRQVFWDTGAAELREVSAHLVEDHAAALKCCWRRCLMVRRLMCFRRSKDALASSEVDVSGREVVQALVIAAMSVVLDEVGDSPFEVAGQEVVFEQDSAFQ